MALVSDTMKRNARIDEIARELALDIQRTTVVPRVAIAKYVEGLETRVTELEQAANNALVYLQNALTEDFGRGSDKAIRVELAAVLGVELP